VKITLAPPDAVRVEDDGGPMTVEAPKATDVYSPFAMLAIGLGVCTLGVLQSWAEQAGLDRDGLAVEVAWTFIEDPHRVGSYRVAIVWPGLPEKRRRAAERAAATCAVHHTLSHPPTIAVEVR
jgi:uncharacterized OsmC-like protein